MAKATITIIPYNQVVLCLNIDVLPASPGDRVSGPYVDPRLVHPGVQAMANAP